MSAGNMAGFAVEAFRRGKIDFAIDYNEPDRMAELFRRIACRFFRDIILWEDLGDIIKATTGVSYGRSELEFPANSITQQTRAFNHREGMMSADDGLPERFLREKTTDCASLSGADLDIMIEEYNAIREGRTLNPPQS